MRRLDDYPIDPEIVAQLDAIDATLAGEPVDPEHAELAELALLLRGERPEIEPEFARSLDERVARRFENAPAGDTERRRWMWEPLAGVVAACFVAAVLVVVIASGGGTSSNTYSSASVPSSAASGIKQAPAKVGSAAAAPGSATTASSAPRAPQPPNNGRKIIQSAQLALTTPASRIETVAQEAFQVIGRENGIVGRSTVTATGGDGYASFQLRVPSSNLAQTMSALSTLRYAHVSSRTDNSQDINDRYVSVTHQLADARALRTALLKQLANASTQQQIYSLNARIHDAEASIASDEATIRGLKRRINFSDIDLTINAGTTPVPVSHGSGGFTIGKAAHDAGRVLTVAAGVALIALAALVPLSLLVALGLWIGAAVRRRRREQALDAA